jgi:hypothetical protein
LQGGTVGNEGAVGQADAQGGADLGTFLGKAVVVLAVDVPRQDEVVLEA